MLFLFDSHRRALTAQTLVIVDGILLSPRFDLVTQVVEDVDVDFLLFEHRYLEINLLLNTLPLDLASVESSLHLLHILHQWVGIEHTIVDELSKPDMLFLMSLEGVDDIEHLLLQVDSLRLVGGDGIGVLSQCCVLHIGQVLDVDHLDAHRVDVTSQVDQV